MLGEKRFFEKSSLALASARHNVGGTLRTVLFCREQKSTKRVAPERANLRFAPSGLPHSLDGLAVADSGLIGARFRHHAFW